MILFSRSKAGVLAVCTMFLILSSLFGVSAATSRTVSAKTHPSTVIGTAHTMKRTGSVAPRTLPTRSAAVDATTTSRLDSANLFHHRKSADTASARKPVVASTHTPPTRGKLLVGFDGVNSVENVATSGLELEPPNEALAVGNGFVVNIVNATGKIYSKSGEVQVGPFSNTDFFGEPKSAYISDPRAFFDKETNTWFAQVFEAKRSESHLDLAVNSSGDPTTPWSVYRFDTTDASTKSCPCYLDHPLFGIDRYNIYLSGNEYNTALLPSYYGAEVYALSKAQLIAQAETINYATFNHLSIDGTLAYQVQPAVTYGDADAEYFLNSFTYRFDVNSYPSVAQANIITDKRLGVWALTNREAVSEGGVPTLSSTIIDSEFYKFVYPDQGKTPVGHNPRFNKDTTSFLDPGNDGMLEVENINGHLLGTLSTTLGMPGKYSPYIGIAWFDVAAKTGDDGLISAETAVADQNYLASDGNYLLYPHIERNTRGLTAIAFSITNLTTYPSAAYAVQQRDGSFGPITIAAAGQAADYGFTGLPDNNHAVLWGANSAGQLDPDNKSIWFATQYTPGVGTNDTNWGNYIFQIDR